jgi:C1A family cysteine protease
MTSGKAVLKTPQSKRWRECQVLPNRAKRLDCGAFTAAFGRAGTIFSPVT